MSSIRSKLSLVALLASVLLWIYGYWIIGIFVTILCIYVCVAVSLLDGIRKPPTNSPEAFIQWKKCHESSTSSSYNAKNAHDCRRPTLLCLGDSLTRGYVSANFTTDIVTKIAATHSNSTLENSDHQPKNYNRDIKHPENDDSSSSSYHHPNRNRLRHLHPQPFHNDPINVINAGYNYVPSHILLRDKINYINQIDPDYVFVLIGTNDMLSIYHKKFQKEIGKFNNIEPDILTMKNFEQNMKDIIQYLYSTASMVRIGIGTIPPLGEDLNSEANRIVQEANQIIKQIVSTLNNENNDRISVIDIYERMENVLLLNQKNHRPRIPWLPRVVTSIDYYLILFMLVCPIQRILSSILSILLLRSLNSKIKWWNRISYCLGKPLSHDGVHFNENARDIVVTLIMQWIQENDIRKSMITAADDHHKNNNEG
jgi:lysophospholipase L1-like esterase